MLRTRKSLAVASGSSGATSTKCASSHVYLHLGGQRESGAEVAVPTVLVASYYCTEREMSASSVADRKSRDTLGTTTG